MNLFGLINTIYYKECTFYVKLVANLFVLIISNDIIMTKSDVITI